MGSPGRPFGPGSISVGLHALDAEDATELTTMLVDQARTAEAAGFDGVTLSEHHGGFPGYMGQPLLACTWILAATERIWSGPAPYLLNLRNPALVAEELAWTAARFPGRFGAAVAAGYAKSDFDLLGVDFADRGACFAEHLTRLQATLAGGAADPAIAAWAEHAPPLLSAANSGVAVKRAAARGLGIFFPGGEPRPRLRELIATYREAGGAGPVVKIRTLWMGTPPPGALEERDRIYREAAAASGARHASGFAEPFAYGSDERILDEVAKDFDALDIDAINVRFYLKGVDHATVVDQIERFGHAVLPRLATATRR